MSKRHWANSGPAEASDISALEVGVMTVVVTVIMPFVIS